MKNDTSFERPLCLSGRNVTKVFGYGSKTTTAVNNVNFDFHEGELVSIVGESGSGKTTLSKMLLGLLNVTSGEILFQGEKRDISTAKRRSSTGRAFRPSSRTPSHPSTYSTRSTPCFWTALTCAAEASSQGQKDRNDDRGLRVCKPEVRRAHEQISLRAFGRPDAKAHDRKNFPSETENSFSR